MRISDDPQGNVKWNNEMPGSSVRHLKLHGASLNFRSFRRVSSTVALGKVMDRIFFYQRIFIGKIFLNHFTLQTCYLLKMLLLKS